MVNYACYSLNGLFTNHKKLITAETGGSRVLTLHFSK